MAAMSKIRNCDIIIIIIVKADTNNHVNGGKHYRWTERCIALTTAQH